LIELMIVVAIIGILVAIALPQYQNYQIRSKVTEALVMGDSIKRALESFYADHDRWPAGNTDAGLPAPADLSSTYIKQIQVRGSGITLVDACGHFRMTFRNDQGLGKLGNKMLWMKPTVPTNGGSIGWLCAVESVNQTKDLVPKECRNGAGAPSFQTCS
jgi:type IV pilus assembly protein PilA